MNSLLTRNPPAGTDSLGVESVVDGGSTGLPNLAAGPFK